MNPTQQAMNALEEMDSCIRTSRAYQRAGKKCAEINPDDIHRWRVALAAQAMAAATASSVPLPQGGAA